MEITNLQPTAATIGSPVIITVDTDIAAVEAVRVGTIHTYQKSISNKRNITFKVPVGLEEGQEYEVSIQLPDGSYVTAAEQLTVEKAPDLAVTITSVIPRSVEYADGRYTNPNVTLKGINMNLIDFIFINNTEVMMSQRTDTSLNIFLNTGVKPGILKRLKIAYEYKGQRHNAAITITVNS